MVGSCVSTFVGIEVSATPDAFVVVPLEAAVPVLAELAELGLLVLGIAGAVCTGRLPSGGTVVGLGPKNLAQARITTRDKSEATTMRSSCVNLNFFSGSLTNAPRWEWLYCVESLARFPARDRTPLSGKPAGTQT